MRQKKRVDRNVGPFLKGLQESRGSGEVAPRRILARLDRGELSVADLFKQTGMDLDEFTRALGSLEKVGLVQVAKGGNPKVALTEAGREVLASKA